MDFAFSYTTKFTDSLVNTRNQKFNWSIKCQYYLRDNIVNMITLVIQNLEGTT